MDMVDRFLFCDVGRFGSRVHGHGVAEPLPNVNVGEHGIAL